MLEFFTVGPLFKKKFSKLSQFFEAFLFLIFKFHRIFFICGEKKIIQTHFRFYFSSKTSFNEVFVFHSPPSICSLHEIELPRTVKKKRPTQKPILWIITMQNYYCYSLMFRICSMKVIGFGRLGNVDNCNFNRQKMSWLHLWSQMTYSSYMLDWTVLKTEIVSILWR